MRGLSGSEDDEYGNASAERAAGLCDEAGNTATLKLSLLIRFIYVALIETSRLFKLALAARPHALNL